jgi:hypothetical protein
MPISDKAEWRRHWAGLLLAVACILPIISLNYYVNPVGRFGPPRQRAINRFTPLYASGIVSEFARPSFYEGTVADRTTDVVLFGNSRAAHGLDTCGHPVARVTGAGWGFAEFTPLIRQALTQRERKATILLELPLVESSASAEPRAPLDDLIYAALAPRVTRASIETVLANLPYRGQPRSSVAANCAADKIAKPVASTSADRAAEQSVYAHPDPVAYARNLAGLRQTVEGADEECRRSGIQHSILFYRMPPTWSVTADMLAVTRRSAADIQSVITPRRRGAACEIRFADFAEHPPGAAADRAKWSDPSLWLDTGHPSPALGKLILPALLAGSGAE